MFPDNPIPKTPKKTSTTMPPTSKNAIPAGPAPPRKSAAPSRPATPPPTVCAPKPSFSRAKTKPSGANSWKPGSETWLDGYQNPPENSILYTFVLKTAQAEWFRRRAQFEYDYFLSTHSNAPITAFVPHELKALELVQRYLTAAERKFQRDYRLLEQHWKSHHKPRPEPKTAARQADSEPEEELDIRFINNETGESVDSFGNEYPPPPNYVCKPIIPGVYGPKHPAYEGPRHRE